MSFFNWIINAFGNVAGFIYSIYLETSGWVWPFHYVSGPFYSLYVMFNSIADLFGYLSDWAYTVWDWISKILSWDNIWSLIKQWAQPLLEWLKNWTSWWYDIWGEIEVFWDIVKYNVQDWIDDAVGGVSGIVNAWNNFWNSLWPQLSGLFYTLKAQWEQFGSYTLPDLINFTKLTNWWNSRVNDVQSLINSAFAINASLWDGWQDMRANVVSFFQDPLEWIWERFADWFLGPE